MTEARKVEIHRYEKRGKSILRCIASIASECKLFNLRNQIRADIMLCGNFYASDEAARRREVTSLKVAELRANKSSTAQQAEQCDKTQHLCMA